MLIRVSVAAVLAFLLTACAGLQEGARAPDRELPFGEYLAGRHASYNMDIRAAADYNLKALSLDPANLLLQRRTLSLAIADGRFEEAFDIAHSLEINDRADDLLYLLLFMEQAKTGHFSRALILLDRMGDVGVYGLFKPLLTAWTYAAEGEGEKVRAVLETALKDPSFRSFKLYHAGLIYEFAGLEEEAGEAYAAALVKTGVITLRNVEAYGRFLQRSGRLQDAAQLYLNYLERVPENAPLIAAQKEMEAGVIPTAFVQDMSGGVAEIFYTAATFLMQDNIRQPATLYLRSAGYMRSDFDFADYLLGQIFEIDEYFTGALEMLGKIPETSPLYFQARLQAAWILDKMEDVDGAVQAMTALSAKYPQKTEIYGALGDLYRMHSRFGEAAVEYTRLIDGIEEPEERHWSLFYTRGIVLEREKRWADAERDFRKALELRPEQPQVLNYLAYSWVDQGMRYDEARKMLERAVEIRPYDGYIVDSLGWALFRMGDVAGAVKILEKAVLLQTDDWAINDHLGDVYWHVGRKNEARFQWRHALSLRPDEDNIPLIKTKIKHGYQK